MNDPQTQYEAPTVEEIDACGDPIKTSPIVSIDN